MPSRNVRHFFLELIQLSTAIPRHKTFFVMPHKELPLVALLCQQKIVFLPAGFSLQSGLGMGVVQGNYFLILVFSCKKLMWILKYFKMFLLLSASFHFDEEEAIKANWLSKSYNNLRTSFKTNHFQEECRAK